MRRPTPSTQRLGSEGQAAVESALTIPLSMFVVLGLLQMGMLQQARMLTDLAAFQVARAASTDRCDCTAMKKAALAALVPTMGRADSLTNWTTTFAKAMAEEALPLRPVRVSWTIDNKVTPFDTMLAANASPERVKIQLYYYYRMEIPFANWILARFYLARYGLAAWTGTLDPTMATHKNGLIGLSAPNNQALIAKAFYTQKKYVAPIYASWSMRMFSQANGTSGSCP